MALLNRIYGESTKNVRIYNLWFHTVWLILCIGHITGTLVIDLPNTFEPRINNLIWLLMACIATSIVSLYAEDFSKKRVIYKYISLLLGSLVEFILGYKYATAYPPLTPMVVIALFVGFWFLGGALYVKRESKVKLDVGVTN